MNVTKKEVHKDLWGIILAYEQKICKCNEEIEKAYEFFDMDAVDKWKELKDAYQFCSAEIMKIIPKYDDPEPTKE